MALTVLAFPEIAGTPAFIGAVALTLGSLAASFAIPWGRLPGWMSMLPALMVICAIGALAAVGLRASVVTLVPLIDLARHHGKRGAAVGVVLAMAASQAELFFTPMELDRDSLMRLLVLPIVFITVTAVVTSLEDRARARVQLMARQGKELAGAYDLLDVDRTLLRGVVSGLTVGVVVLDGTGKVIHVNDAVTRYGSVPLTPGLDVGPFLADESGEMGSDLREYLGRALGDDPVTDETRWWTLRDGSQVALRANVIRIVPPRARGTFRMLVLEDLTVEVSAVREREEFIGSVSHELRTPLTSVLGYIELAQDDEETTESVQGWLEIAERNVRKLDLLVGDLLTDAASRHAMSGSSEVEDVAIGPLVHDTVQSLRPRAERSEVQVEAAVADGLIVRGDPMGVGRVMENLLSNAIKYSDPGGQVTVLVTGDGEFVEIQVADQGIGISQQDQERLFQRFYRAEAVRASRRGTGLGLHLVREIVEGHGGQVLLTSELGVGTTVNVRLPRARPEVADRRGELPPDWVTTS